MRANIEWLYSADCYFRRKDLFAHTATIFWSVKEIQNRAVALNEK